MVNANANLGAHPRRRHSCEDKAAIHRVVLFASQPRKVPRRSASLSEVTKLSVRVGYLRNAMLTYRERRKKDRIVRSCRMATQLKPEHGIHRSVGHGLQSTNELLQISGCIDENYVPPALADAWSHIYSKRHISSQMQTSSVSSLCTVGQFPCSLAMPDANRPPWTEVNVRVTTNVMPSDRSQTSSHATDGGKETASEMEDTQTVQVFTEDRSFTAPVRLLAVEASEGEAKTLSRQLCQSSRIPWPPRAS